MLTVNITVILKKSWVVVGNKATISVGMHNNAIIDRHAERMAKKKRMFRDKYYRRQKGAGVYKTLTTDGSLVHALTTAAMHAGTVCLRDHVVPETKVRVGEFVTSLRREITVAKYHNSYLNVNNELNKLTDKDNWVGILEPKSHDTFSNDLMSLIRKAQHEISNQSSAAFIENELKRVENVILDTTSLLKEIQALNDEADVILSDFRSLAKKMEENK